MALYPSRTPGVSRIYVDPCTAHGKEVVLRALMRHGRIVGEGRYVALTFRREWPDGVLERTDLPPPSRLPRP